MGGSYTGEIQGNPRGGHRRGVIVEGFFEVDNDFYCNDYGTVFIANPFGTPSFLAGNFPGFPNHPMSAPGVRVLFNPLNCLEPRGAVYAGTTLSENDNPRSQPVIRGRDGVISIYEAAYRHHQEQNATGLPGTFKFGAVFHSRFRGPLNANPASASRPLTALYLTADQAVWRGPAPDARDAKDKGSPKQAAEGDRPTLGVFARFAEGGLNLKGPFPGRGQDVIGLGVVHGGVGNHARP